MYWVDWWRLLWLRWNVVVGSGRAGMVVGVDWWWWGWIAAVCCGRLLLCSRSRVGVLVLALLAGGLLCLRRWSCGRKAR